jgi:tetratricopeptide (TPR) repeat protein
MVSERLGAVAILLAMVSSGWAVAEVQTERLPTEADQLEDPPNPFLPVASSQAELDAFRAIEIETRLSVRLGLIELFLSTYPDSELHYPATRTLWRTLVDAQAAPNSIIEAADRGRDAARAFFEPRLAAYGQTDPEASLLARFEESNVEASYLRSMASAAGRMGDLELTARYTQDALDAEDAVWDAFREVERPDTPQFIDQLSRHHALETGLLQNAMLVFRSRGDLDSALEYGKRLLEIAPDDLLTLTTLATTIAEDESLSSSRADAGLDYADRALDVIEGLRDTEAGSAGSALGKGTERVEASLRTMKGRLQYQREDYEAAVSEFGKALELVPDDADTHYRTGLAYARLGRLDEALGGFARAVFLGIDDPEARASLEQIYEVVYGSREHIEDFVSSHGAAMGLTR